MIISRRFGGTAAAGALMLALSGCGTMPKQLQDFPRDQVCVINGKGTLLEPVGNCSGDRYSSLKLMDQEIPRDDEGAYATNIANGVVAQLQAGREVVIYFHGGLNTQVGTMDRAHKLLSYATNQVDHAPHFVFVNWQSSLLSSYWDHLVSIREAKDYRLSSRFKRFMVGLTSPLYLLSDLLSGVARLPVTAERQSATFFNNLRLGPTEDIKKASNGFACAQALTNVSSITDMGVSLRHAIPSTVLGPLRLVTVPLVDALGNPAWDVMQRRASILFNRDLIHEDRRMQEEGSCFLQPELHQRGPLFKLGVALEEALSRQTHTGRLVLVGHSMGAIIGAEFLRHFHGVPLDEVVFMAGACRVRDLAEGVFPYLVDQPRTRFHNLVLHPQAETRESNLYHIAPEGSLLVWLDQMLDRPDTSSDRMAGRYVNLGMNANYLEEAAQRLDPALPGRISIKVFPYLSGSELVAPMKHGDFGRFNFWEERFWLRDYHGPYGVFTKEE